MTLALPLDLSPVINRPYLTPAELDEIAYQLDQLDAPRPPRKDRPTNTQLPIATIDARGAILCALARSPIEHERAAALARVRAELERTRATVDAAAALEVSARWIQLLIKQHPALCQGLKLRSKGAPPKAKNDDDDKPQPRPRYQGPRRIEP